MPSQSIVVIGSINMDLVCRTSRIPAPGETVMGERLLTLPGGKGANQAVAAAKLARPGVKVELIGRVGDDDFGDRLLNGLQSHHVGTEHVTISEGQSSGCATILVDRKGENSIVMVPGANAKLSVADLDGARDIIKEAGVVVLQLEIPLDTVQQAIAICRGLGVYVILDPAPVPPRGMPRALYDVDLLAPNQSEAELLAGEQQPASERIRRKLFDPKSVGAKLLRRGSRNVVLKLGSRGAMIVDVNGGIERVRPFKVSVVDTTAAGDAFVGALAVSRLENMPLTEAVRFANAAGALACTAIGAQPSLPSRAAVDELLNG